MTPPRLSILVPTYNRAGYLQDCLASLEATTVDCEILVADNASSDETASVLARAASPRLRTFRHATNIGSHANHNFLLAQARGETLCFFGDDDVALPGCFEPKLALLSAHPRLVLVYSAIAVIDALGQPLVPLEPLGLPRHGYVGGRDEFLALLPNCYIAWQTAVIRRSRVVEVGDLADAWGLAASADWHWLQRLVRGRETAYLPVRTVAVRQHAASFSRSEGDPGGHWAHDRLVIWRRWLLEDPHPPFVEQALWDRMATALALDFGAADPTSALGQLAELRARYEQAGTARVWRAAQAGLDPNP